MTSLSRRSDRAFGAALIVGLALGLYLARSYSFLLFHSLVELFTVAVAWSIFFLAWNARRFLDNHYLLFVGIASLYVGALDAVHLLAYKGMGVFPDRGADVPTQLWIAGRYLESGSLLLAPLFLRRRLHTGLASAIYTAASALLIAAIFAGLFPVCYVEGVGLTRFKIASEYAIAALLLASVWFVYRRREMFDRPVLHTLTAAIILNTGAELAFTGYTTVDGIWNEIGHLLRFAAYCLIYRAIVVRSMMNPYDVLFRNLARKEEALRRSEERYRVFVANSSDGICRIEVDPPVPTSLPLEQQVQLIGDRGRIAECNETYARMHGGEADRIIGASYYDLVCRSDAGFAGLFERFVHAGYATVEAELLSADADGAPRSLTGSLTGVVENGCLVRVWSVQRDVTAARQSAIERERLIAELQQALAEVRNLSGLLPICANCKKVRDDQGYWTQVEAYLLKRTGVSFSHGICPDCAPKLYPGYFSPET